MKLGANSVLFGGFDMETAFKYIAMAGYDGIELSAIDTSEIRRDREECQAQHEDGDLHAWLLSATVVRSVPKP